jgi:hypothetical protein
MCFAQIPGQNIGKEVKSMKRIEGLLSIGTLACFLLASGPAFAATVLESDSQPQLKTYNGIPYVSGGIGVEERDQLQAATNADNLQLSFALQSGNYLGGANVVIKDSSGNKVLEAVSDGPLFFTKLPPGKYTIDATAMGKTVEQVTQVPAKGQKHVYFAWNEPEEGSTAF